MNARTLLMACGLAIGGLGSTATADIFELNPAALNFNQVDLNYQFAVQPLSAYSWAGVRGSTAVNGSGLAGHAGYVNIADASGNWVVQNLPIDRTWDAGGLGTEFDLGNAVGQRVTSFQFRSVISDDPLGAFPATLTNGNPVALNTAPVGRQDLRAEGDSGDGILAPQRMAPNPLGRRPELPNGFNPLPTMICYQPGHPNIEQDDNQCATASVSNSMKYLNAPNTPAFQGPGIRNNSLVGQLDRAATRAAHMPVNSALWIRGKQQVLSNNNIDLMSTYKQTNNGHNVLPGGDIVGGRFRATEDTSAQSFVDWLIDQVCAGKDVELRMGWDEGGGHVVQLLGAGKINGQPFVIYGQDANQGWLPDMPPVGPPDPNGVVDINGGVGFLSGGIGFSWIRTGADTRLSNFNGNPFISFAVAEMIPAPGSALVLALAGLATARRRRG